MRSLQGKLSLALAVSLVALLALQWLVASVAISRLMERQLAARLAKDAESLLSALEPDPRGGLRLDASRVSSRYHRPLSGFYYTVSAGALRETSRSLWDEAIESRTAAPGEALQFRTVGPERQPLFAVVHGYRMRGQEVAITVAEDLRALDAGVRRFQVIHGAVSVAILAALLLVQRRIVVRSLRGLADVQADMEKLAAGKTTRIDAGGPLEIAPLIAQLNSLLQTMGRRSRRSREALGNLAHALKTRLAVLNQIAEQPEMAAHPHLRSTIREATDGVRRIVERELKRARLAGEALPGQRIGLRDEVLLLSKTLGLLHAAKAPRIEWAVGPEAAFPGDREDLLELLGNLLDNACQWCRTTVRFEAGAARGLALVVEDDGPGCAEQDLEALAHRGFRADESRPGSGLGLAIVRDIVDTYGGSLAFGRSTTLGGLRVEVNFPGTQPASTPPSKGESA